MSTCQACRRALSTNDDSNLQCSICKRYWHGLCANPQPVHVYSRNTWTCAACISPASIQSASQSNIEIEEVRFNAIMRQLSAVTSSVEKLSDLVAAQSTAISNCLSEIAALRHENVDLRTKVDDLEMKINSLDSDNIQIEILDRIRRKNNIVIMGVPETSRGLENDDIQRLIDSLVPGVSANLKTCFRIGKTPKPENTGNPRPIKVVFKSEDDSLSILKNKKKIDTNEFQGISIKADLTFAQLSHLSSLREEMKKRQHQGEQNLTIKYVKNIPQIINTTTAGKRSREEDESPKGPHGSKQSKSEEQ